MGITHHASSLANELLKKILRCPDYTQGDGAFNTVLVRSRVRTKDRVAGQRFGMVDRQNGAPGELCVRKSLISIRLPGPPVSLSMAVSGVE